MRFTPIIAALALVTGISAEVSANKMAQSIEKINQISSQTNDLVKDISSANVDQKAPQAIENFQQITKVVSDMGQDCDQKDLGACLKESYGGLSETEQQALCTTFHTLDFIKYELFRISGRHNSIFSLTPVAKASASILRHLEDSLDKIAFAIIDMPSNCKPHNIKN